LAQQQLQELYLEEQFDSFENDNVIIALYPYHQ